MCHLLGARPVPGRGFKFPAVLQRQRCCFSKLNTLGGSRHRISERRFGYGSILGTRRALNGVGQMVTLVALGPLCSAALFANQCKLSGNKPTHRRIFLNASSASQEFWHLLISPNMGALIMKRFVALCMVLCLAGAFVGCEKKAEVKKTTTVTAPGGTTTETESTKVETSGEHPPATK